MSHTTLDRHWDAAYAEGDADRSWTQDEPSDSLAAIALAAPAPSVPVIDVGGGSSRLASRLLERGHTDITVLDLSREALRLARRRLGDRSGAVTWVVADVLAWTPQRAYGIWHDRALLHFFTDERDRERYAATLRSAIEVGGHAILATFAPEGPEQCSGLAVRRSSAAELEALLGDGFTTRRAAVLEHRTPSGAVQPFTWLVARRTR